MSIARSVVGDPYTFVVTALSGNNYLIALDEFETSILALLSSDGLRTSPDRGQSWGSTLAEGVGGPWGMAFKLPRTLGILPANRILLTQAEGTGAHSNIQYTDDEGASVSNITVPAFTPNRGARLIQAKAPYNSVLGKFVENGGLIVTTDGTTWNSVTDANCANGISLQMRNNGTIYWHGASTINSNIRVKKSTDGGSIFTAAADTAVGFPIAAAGDKLETRSDYHKNDDVLMIACKSWTGSAYVIRVATMNASEAYVEIATLIGTGIVHIDWVAAINSISGRWAISVRTATKSQLWVTGANLATWTKVLEYDLATAGEGIMVNLTQYGV